MGALNGDREDTPRVQLQSNVWLLAYAPVGLAAAAGLGAWALPLGTNWFLIAPAQALLAAVLCATNRSLSILQAAAIAVITFLGLSGVISATISTALIAALVLACSNGRRSVGLAIYIVTLQLSFMQTLESSLSDTLARWGLESASPTIVGGIGLLLVSRRHFDVIITLAMVALCSISLRHFRVMPDVELAVCALILMIGTVRCPFMPNLSPNRTMLLTVLLMFTWALTPPGFPQERSFYIVMPDAPDAPEAMHYAGLTEALRFVGLPFTRVVEPESIPNGALVLLPWLSASFGPNEPEYIERLRSNANRKKWTVILFGEHTGIGGLDKRAEQLVSAQVFRNDLTVPPRNADTSGMLRAPDAAAWPPLAILNRGSTTMLASWRSRVLLSGDGWWADQDINEWLWSGDYRWREGDRGGRLTLAHSHSERGGARFVMVGDSSPILTKQVIADPRPAKRLIEMSSLWPMLQADLLLGGIALVLYFVHSSTGVFFSAVLIIGGGLAMRQLEGLSIRIGENWRALYVGEGGFEQSNFNVAIAESSDLMNSGWRFQRHRGPLSGEIKVPDEPAVSFFIVQAPARFSSVEIKNCKRIGNLPVFSEGPFLKDAQACEIHGAAEILIGERTSAAAFRVKSRAGEQIVILDQGFLSVDAPTSNREWLVKQIKLSDGR